jgi:hypothetical protein
MLLFNGKKYAKNDAEFTDSLFTEQTCTGYYKKMRNGIKLFNIQNELIAFIVNNTAQGFFVVSASTFENKPYYSYGLSDSTADYLGLSLTANESDIVKAAHII